MKLSDTDKENIEVLESLSIDENALLGLFCLYFSYRYRRRTSGTYGLTPNQALQETIRTAMKATEMEEQQS